MLRTGSPALPSSAQTLGAAVTTVTASAAPVESTFCTAAPEGQVWVSTTGTLIRAPAVSTSCTWAPAGQVWVEAEVSTRLVGVTLAYVKVSLVSKPAGSTSLTMPLAGNGVASSVGSWATGMAAVVGSTTPLVTTDGFPVPDSVKPGVAVGAAT